MNKLQFTFSTVLALLSILIYTSCNNKEKECECCKGWGSTEVKVQAFSGEIVTLKIPSAFTPSNLKFCDSNIYVDGRLSDIGCRKNLDSVYNDDLNDRFQIIGIEKFPQNDLIIRVPGDTTAIDHYFNFSNNGRSFNGIKIDTTLYGHERQRQLESNRFMFILQLYKDTDTLKHLLKNRVDSITGYFCIIRNKDFCNIGCEGKEANDPLIK